MEDDKKDDQINDKKNVAVNTKFLADSLNLNRKTIQRDLNRLQAYNLVRWIGSAKKEYWIMDGR